MISVVIPCLNEVEFIDATLESLLRGSLAPADVRT